MNKRTHTHSNVIEIARCSHKEIFMRGTVFQQLSQYFLPDVEKVLIALYGAPEIDSDEVSIGNIAQEQPLILIDWF